MEIMILVETFTPLIVGALAGVTAGLSPYFRQKMTNKNMKFDLKKLYNTTVYGAIIGIVATVQGIPLEAATNLVLGPLAPILATVGLVHISQNAKRGVVEAIKNKK